MKCIDIHLYVYDEMIVNYKLVIYLLSYFMSLNCDAVSMKKAKPIRTPTFIFKFVHKW